MSDLVALRPGTILADDYRIERTLGAGGFGITYLAEEIALARLVTIKEYFPVDFAARDQAEDVVPRSRESEGDYTWGLDRFLTEAQTLARFNHANIVRVYRFFQARNTGYIVLHYEDGASLKGWLKALGRAPRQNEIDRLLEPLLDALETVHAADYLHRDIAPDNIMIRKDGEPVLIDFGSARGDIAKHSKTISALVKPGYSPYEQYATTSRQQGPWTDIYSLGATLYEAVTGRRPPDAPSRMVSDELVPPADAALSSYRPRFLAAIGKALRLEINDRPRSISDWRAELLAPTPQRREEPRSPEPVAAAQAEPVAAAAAGASKAGGSTKAKAPPEPAAAAVAEAASAPPARRGLAAAFLDGWRKGNAPADVERAPRPRKSAAAPSAPAAAPPADAAPAPAARKKKRRSAVPAAAEMSPQRHVWPFGLSRRHQLPAAPEPGARRATPRALRKRSGQGWRALAAKLVLAFCVAAGMVAIQEQLPTVRREGAGLLTSQTNTDVPLAELKGHRGAVTGLAFLPDSQRIVTSSADGTVKVWNTARGGLIRTIELDAGPATAFAVAKERAATGHKDGTVALWNIETGSNLATFRRSDASIWAIAFAGGPDRVAAAAQDWAVTLWEAGRPQSPVRVFEGHENAVKAVAFAERGPFIASGGADAVVKLWNVDKGELVRTYRGHEEAIAAVAFDPEGRTLASTSQDGQIRLWSTYSSRLKKRLRGHEGSVPGLAYAPDGHYLVSGGSDGTVRIWDTERGKPVRTMKSGVGAVGALGVSPDGRKIAAAGADGTVRVFVAVLPKDGS